MIASIQKLFEMEMIMDIRPIRTEEDYQQALQKIEELFDSLPYTLEADLLEVLVTLVDAYEKENYPIPLPDPIEAINFRMDASKLTPRDLEPYIGSRARVWEILNLKRPLSLRMIRRLEIGLGIPAEILIQEYELEGHVSKEYDQHFWVTPVGESSRYYIHFAGLTQSLQSSLNEEVIHQAHEQNDCYWGVIINTFLSSTSVDSIGELHSTDSDSSSYACYQMSGPQDWRLLREGCFERYWNESSLEIPTQEEV